MNDLQTYYNIFLIIYLIFCLWISKVDKLKFKTKLIIFIVELILTIIGILLMKI